MQEMEKIGNRRFVVVYFSADTHLGLFPNNTFFLDAHSALRASHRRQMKVRYCLSVSMCMSGDHLRPWVCCCGRDGLHIRKLRQLLALSRILVAQAPRLHAACHRPKSNQGLTCQATGGMHLHRSAIMHAERRAILYRRGGCEGRLRKTISLALQALYVVHPNPLLRAWIISLRLSEPDIYGRVDYCERLANLNVYFAGGKAPVPPQHVLDYDAEH